MPAEHELPYLPFTPVYDLRECVAAELFCGRYCDLMLFAMPFC